MKTVQDLITALQAFRPEMPVYLFDEDGRQYVPIPKIFVGDFVYIARGAVQEPDTFDKRK